MAAAPLEVKHIAADDLRFNMESHCDIPHGAKDSCAMGDPHSPKEKSSPCATTATMVSVSFIRSLAATHLSDYRHTLKAVSIFGREPSELARCGETQKHR